MGLSNEDFDKVQGIVCNQCGEETFRILNGLCPQCQLQSEAARAERAEERAMRKYYKRRLRRGDISLAQVKDGH